MDRGTSSRRLTWLLAVLAAAVAAGLAAVLAPLPPFDSTVRLPAAAFAVCFAVAELAVVQVPLREHRARVSLAEIPLVVGLFFIAPTELMAARVIGAGVVMLLRRQLPGPALLTRLALLGLATSLAILLFRGGAILVPQSFPVWLAAYPAALGAAIVAGLTGSIAVPGRRVREALAAQGPQAGLGVLIALFSTSVALVVVVFIRRDINELILLLPPALTALLAYRAFVALHEGDAALRESRERALDLVAALDRANAELRRASEAKSEYVATMSHELRTPLHSILVASELIGDPLFGSLSEDKVRELAGTIHGSGRHLLQLVDSLVDLSTIEAGRLELHPESIPVSQLLAEVRVEIAPLAREQGVVLDVPAEPGPTVTVDPLRMRQVLVNLVANAVKFTPPGGRVWVEVGASDGSARIDVHDNGIGIAAEDLARVFLPFEQVSAASAQGTGLGLAIARRLVDLHGGRLDVASTPGLGSTFTVMLPGRVRPRTEAAYVAPGAPPVSLAARAPTSVLVVEDDTSGMALVAALLAEAGYDVVRAESLRAAHASLRDRTPELVLLDLRLEDGDGLDLARHLRAAEATRALPILALSAEARPEDVRRAMQAGCDEYLTKPISPRDLLARVRDALAGGGPGRTGARPEPGAS